MPLAGAMSVTAFSVVLSEVFTAVGLSTLVPATFIELARAARKLADDPAIQGLTEAELSKALESVSRFLPVPGGDGAALATKVLQTLFSSSDTIDLLLPKTATIEADFKFQAREKEEANLDVGMMIDVVTVKGGYGMLYEESSSSSVHLKIDYVSVQEQLAGARFVGTPVSSGTGPQSVKVGETIRLAFGKSLKDDATATNTKITLVSERVAGVIKITGVTAASGSARPTVTVNFDDGTIIKFPCEVTA